CSIASELLSDQLDEIDLIKGAYYLEVSSPGAERPLKTKEDIENHIDHNIHVSLYAQIDGSKEYEGILKSITNNQVTNKNKVKKQIKIKYKNKTRVKKVSIPYEKIAKARLAVTF